MKVGKSLYVSDRKSWRRWLSKHHKSAPEIWLQYYKRASGFPRIAYSDAVEEALCYGWIDSILKPGNKNFFFQRFSPRKKNSNLSVLNKERIRRLIKSKKMTKYGLESIRHHLEFKNGDPWPSKNLKKFSIPSDILLILQSDPILWKNFKKFPASYKRIRIGWIDMARQRPAIFNQRLQYFLKMTLKNKRFGMIQ